MWQKVALEVSDTAKLSDLKQYIQNGAIDLRIEYSQVLSELERQELVEPVKKENKDETKYLP